MHPVFYRLHVAANAATHHTPTTGWSYNATVTIIGVAAIAMALLIAWIKRNNY